MRRQKRENPCEGAGYQGVERIMVAECLKERAGGGRWLVEGEKIAGEGERIKSTLIEADMEGHICRSKKPRKEIWGKKRSKKASEKGQTTQLWKLICP